MKIVAISKFIAFLSWAVVFAPMFVISGMLPRNARVNVLQLFMATSFRIMGFRSVKVGEVAAVRPLMIVGNHIGWLELFALPSVIKVSFFGKAELRSWPVLGWIIGALGVVFVDRRPSKVRDSIKEVAETMAVMKYPVALFPEGTTTNGAYVKEFKSSLFNFMEGQLGGEFVEAPTTPRPSGAPLQLGGEFIVSIQPYVQIWKYKNGQLISDDDLAQNWAYFDNDKITQGAKAAKPRNIVSAALYMMAQGGCIVENHFLPVVDLSGVRDRKELAEKLQGIVSEKYRELRMKIG
ncbi:MAG: 1-acyl-sn-glycerol-3-phosphate acyltransferase [Rickettsiales bacterium]|jgi:1-acyl-sn-glycerol-3-phosphate acyltransferase|nr:1-acyl-sn-glycerol-3-phosphate acyltransferase [Rickettsiales bacterium]